MTLADKVLAKKRQLSNNPQFTHLSDDVIALCAVLEEEAIHLTTCPRCYAAGTEGRLTAKPRSRKGAKE